MKKNINTAYGNIREKIERGIIEKLKYAWESICECLEKRNHDLALRINLPSIVLTDIKTCLGQWNNEYYEIRLSRQLVFNGRWDSVCEVLRHEMAHQLAATFPEYKKQPPHGKIFIECCKAVNANPKASGSYETLEQRVFGNKENENDKIIIKVKKLMNLASSDNGHEAEAAAAKAGEFIRRYNIDLIKQDKKRGFESIIITDTVLKRSQAQMLIAPILEDFYFVTPIWLSTYIPEKGKMGKELEISGTLTNLKIADYVFHYVLQYAERSWQKYKLKNPGCRSRSGYMTGIVNGFREKLEEQQALSITKQYGQSDRNRSDRQNGFCNTPAVIEDKQLVKYWNERYPSVVTARAYYRSTSISAYNSGKSRGKKLTISKGISNEHGNCGKLISIH
jgi:predicted SprT family Zn-dependent metalloprotease